MIFVDTNFFLRFFRDDIQSQHSKAKELFLEASRGKVNLTTSTIVFFEIYWVLKSYYGETKVQILNVLNKLIGLRFILIEDRVVLEESLILFKRVNLELEDCYNISYAKSRAVKEFKTFDIKLLKEFQKKS